MQESTGHCRWAYSVDSTPACVWELCFTPACIQKLFVSILICSGSQLHCLAARGNHMVLGLPTSNERPALCHRKGNTLCNRLPVMQLRVNIHTNI